MESAQTRTGWDTDTDGGVGKDSKKGEEKKQRCWLGLDSSSPSERGRREFTCSSSLAEKRRPVAFTAAEQYHSWLPSWQESLLSSRLFTVTPPHHLFLPHRFFLYVPLFTHGEHLHSACLTSILPMVPGRHVMRKRAAPVAFLFLLFVTSAAAVLFFLRHMWAQTGGTASRPRWWLLASGEKRPDPENQMESCQAESGAPAVPGPSRWRQGWGPGFCKKQMNGGKLMDPISQQLSNAGCAQVRRTPADNEGLLPPNEHISYVSHLDFLFYPLNAFPCQLAVAAEHLLSQWVEGKQRRENTQPIWALFFSKTNSVFKLGHCFYQQSGVGPCSRERRCTGRCVETHGHHCVIAQ